MKILYLSITVVVFFIAASLILDSRPAYASGGIMCGYHLLFEKYEFVSENVIPIKILVACDQWQGRTATLVVSDGDSTGVTNKYLDKQITINDKAEVDFSPPTNSNQYRFLVTVRDDNGNIQDKAFIFTKQNASNITISDLSVSPNVTAGGQLTVIAKIRDGLGKPVPGVYSSLEIVRPVCGIPTFSNPSTNLEPNGAGDTFAGNLSIPNDFSTGTYNVTVSAASYDGFHYQNMVMPVKIKNNGIEPATSLFYHITDTNPALVSRTFISVSEAYHAPGDKIILKGQTLSSSCQPLREITINGSITTEEGTVVITNQTVSDNAGNFFITFQTPLKMSLFPPNQYEFHLDANYGNKTFGWGGGGSGLYPDLRFEDIKRFSFNVDGKNSTADLTGDGISQVSITLDKILKKITLEGNTATNQSYFDLYIPSELLGGTLTVVKSPTEIMTTANSYQQSYVGDYQSGFGVEVRMYSGLEEITYHPSNIGSTKLEIFGTTVIPEFPFVQLVLVIGITSLTILYRTKILK